MSAIVADLVLQQYLCQQGDAVVAEIVIVQKKYCDVILYFLLM